MKRLGGQVEFIGSFPGALPSLGLPEIAFAGRSNVGKSSALNCLMGSKRAARVSSRPGRTQAINLFRVQKRVVFADLPGYGFAKVPEHVQARWKPMIETYLGTRDALVMVVVLLDARREPLPMDRSLVEGLDAAGIATLLVATKADKLKPRALRQQLDGLERAYGRRPLPFSSVTRTGVREVWAAIDGAIR